LTAHDEAHGLADSGEILRFWFDEAGPDRWFDSDPAFDETLRVKFGAAHEAAARGQFDDWAQTADGALALLILLDQLPRNLFRGTARAFATDAKARAVAEAALARGFDLAQPPARRLFFYLPLMHSEALPDQERCVGLVRALGPDGSPNLPYALQHRSIIERFGRFPHRNAALGRSSTQEEQEFLRTFAGF
jgi:uncharacterized protein (DUF924 family)